jgi:hypothetical protein
MKSDLLYEVSSVFSFFLRQNGIESVNLRYLGFFYKDYEKKNQLGKMLGLKKPGSVAVDKELVAAEWKSVSREEYNFCLTRLSKNLSFKEKISMLLLLLDSCHYNNWFVKERMDFLEIIAQRLGVELDWLVKLKKVLTFYDLESGRAIADGNILLMRVSEFNPWKKAQDSSIELTTRPVLGYIYSQEQMTAFVRVFERNTKINGFLVEPNKIYPMNEGDVLSCNDKLLSFNGVFRHYFNSKQFASLSIEATETTPKVHFDSVENNLEISGCCVPENGMEFYAPLYNWLDSYLMSKPSQINVNIRLDYFNTTSSKCILDFLFRLQRYKNEKVDLQINWFFQDGDDDLEEAGLNYSEIVKIPFALIPYN